MVHDRIQLTILGPSPACPNPGSASAGYLISAHHQHLLLDCGHGIAGALQTNLSLDRLTAIIISHMHPDHFLDLIPLKYGLQFSGAGRVPLYLPPGGLQELDRLRPALGLDDSFFTDAYDSVEYDPTHTLTLAGLHIVCAPTKHFIPAYSMRFTLLSGGPALAYSSDTAWTEPVLDLLRGADLAIMEATEPSMQGDTPSAGHLSPRLAGELAREAGVNRLVLTHYWHTNADLTLHQGRAAFGGPTFLARQGDTYGI